MANYTTNELMAVCAAGRLQNGMTVAVGLGLPQMACILAKSTHAPDMNIFFELGVYNPVPVDTGLDLADTRIWYDADYFTGFIGVLGELLQGGHVDVGFLGALQTDMYGNLNSTLVRNPDGSIRHFTGSGGAADIATFSKNVFIIIKHEPRKIAAQLDYLTSVGCYRGGRSRTEKGLPPTAGVTVFTNLCIMTTGAESGRLELKSLHPGVSLDTLRASTGFDLIIPKDYEITPEPDPEYLRVLREVVDPGKLYIK